MFSRQPFIDAGWTDSGWDAQLTNDHNVSCAVAGSINFGRLGISLRLHKDGKSLRTVTIVTVPERQGEITSWLIDKIPSLTSTTKFDWLLEKSLTGVAISVASSRDTFHLPESVPAEPAVSGEVPVDLPESEAWQAPFLRRGWSQGGSGVFVELTLSDVLTAWLSSSTYAGDQRLHRLCVHRYDGREDEYTFIVYPGQDERVATALDQAVRAVKVLGDARPFEQAALGNLVISRVVKGVSTTFPMQFDLDFAAGTRGIVDPRRPETAPLIAHGWDYQSDSTGLVRTIGGFTAIIHSDAWGKRQEMSIFLKSEAPRRLFEATFDPFDYDRILPEILAALDTLDTKTPSTVAEFATRWEAWGGTVSE